MYPILSSYHEVSCLISCWAFCAVVALLFAWLFGPGKSIPMKVTVVRKFFHLVIVFIFFPGAYWFPKLLFAASIFALAAFFVLEAIRLYNLGALGAVLNSSMPGFLDEKDNGHLILSHTYLLLVGCSLPVWILPATEDANTHEMLILYCGLISLGVGDSAASVGGSNFGRTKWSGSNKSLEGTACFIASEIVFILILQFFGIFGGSSSPFPWPSYLLASLVTSLVEAHTTQADNLVLPLVMYIVLLI